MLKSLAATAALAAAVSAQSSVVLQTFGQVNCAGGTLAPTPVTINEGACVVISSGGFITFNYPTVNIGSNSAAKPARFFTTRFTSTLQPHGPELVASTFNQIRRNNANHTANSYNREMERAWASLKGVDSKFSYC